MVENVFVYDVENQREGYVTEDCGDVVLHYARYKDNWSKYQTGNVAIKLTRDEAMRMLNIIDRIYWTNK